MVIPRLPVEGSPSSEGSTQRSDGMCNLELNEKMRSKRDQIPITYRVPIGR